MCQMKLFEILSIMKSQQIEILWNTFVYHSTEQSIEPSSFLIISTFIMYCIYVSRETIWTSTNTVMKGRNTFAYHWYKCMCASREDTRLAERNTGILKPAGSLSSTWPNSFLFLTSIFFVWRARYMRTSRCEYKSSGSPLAGCLNWFKKSMS